MAILVERTQPTKREDIANLLTVVDAHSCPMASMIPKGERLSNMLYEYPADAYLTPVTTPKVDGVRIDPANHRDHSANRGLIQGRGHFYQESFAASRLAGEVSDVAGVGKAKEFAKNKADALVVAKRAMETVILSANDSQADNGTVGYRTRGLGEAIKATAQTDLPVPAAFRPPAASISTGVIADLDEEVIRDVMESQWNASGIKGEQYLVCGAKIKRRITDYMDTQTPSGSAVPLRRFDQKAADAKVTINIDIFEGDFGIYKLLVDFWMPTTYTAYAVPMDKVELRPHTMPHFAPLPEQGAGEEGYIEWVCGLATKNPKGMAKFVYTAS